MTRGHRGDPVAKITVTQSSPPNVVVGNKDTVKVEIPGGGDVTIEASGSSVGKLKISFKDDTHSDTVRVDLSTFAKDNLHIDIKNYDTSDKILLTGATNMQVNPSDPDEYTFDYIGSDGNTYTGFIHAKDGGEQNFNLNPINVPCFCSDTLIQTNLGRVSVQELEVGNLVKTRDHGLQPIRWIGRRYIDGLHRAANAHLRPILIKKDALGVGIPSADLRVSPQHRILLNGWKLELLFGEANAFVAAKHLVDDGLIQTDYTCASVEYFHIMFDQHEVVFSNNLETESLFVGQQANTSFQQDALTELYSLFPTLRMWPETYGATARMVLKPTEMNVLRGF